MTPNQNPAITGYTFNEHKHRYAIWTAARAVQRSFTTTDKIAAAVETTTLRQFAETTEFITGEQYDLQQAEWCYKLIDCFEPLECSYGRAAKIVAIYLKTAVIFPSQGTSALCEVIHPPVDSILLSNLVKWRELKELRGERWTTFTSAEYWNVVDIIRTSIGYLNWKLEAFWQPQQQTLEITEL